MDQNDLAGLVVAEIRRAVEIAVDQVVSGIPLGTVLLPWPIAIGVVGYALFDGMETVAKQLQRSPSRIVSQILVARALKFPSTKVVRLDKAAQFAGNVALGSVFNLSGQIPPPGIHTAIRASHLHGIRKLLIKLGQKALLGGTLYTLFKFIRAPAGFLIRFVELFWNGIIVVLSIGSVLVLWDLVEADWESIALSQKHPRKRLQCVKINKRL